MADKKRFNLKICERPLPFDQDAAALVALDQLAASGVRDVVFQFVHRHVAFTVRLDDDGKLVRLAFGADLGPMPFTSESAMARAGLKAVVVSAQQHLGGIVHVERGRIRVDGAVEFSSPLTAVGLVSAIVSFLLPLNPYLRTVDMFVSTLGDAAMAAAARYEQTGGLDDPETEIVPES